MHKKCRHRTNQRVPQNINYLCTKGSLIDNAEYHCNKPRISGGASEINLWANRLNLNIYIYIYNRDTVSLTQKVHQKDFCKFKLTISLLYIYIYIVNMPSGHSTSLVESEKLNLSISVNSTYPYLINIFLFWSACSVQLRPMVRPYLMKLNDSELVGCML
jgi:hypothetical protein